MPGIRELERALVEHYLTFSDFQGKFYWSASAAKGVGVREQTDRARATRAIVIPGEPVNYAESGSTNDRDNYSEGGKGGRALRSEPLRIRAFYKNNR